MAGMGESLRMPGAPCLVSKENLNKFSRRANLPSGAKALRLLSTVYGTAEAVPCYSAAASGSRSPTLSQRTRKYGHPALQKLLCDRLDDLGYAVSGADASRCQTIQAAGWRVDREAISSLSCFGEESRFCNSTGRPENGTTFAKSSSDHSGFSSSINSGFGLFITISLLAVGPSQTDNP